MLCWLLLLVPGCRWNDEVRPDDSPWGYAQPGSRGFDEPQLLVLDSLFNTRVLGGVSSMLIVKEGKMVFENYYGFQTRDSLQSVSSMGNMIVSLLVGIAIDKGVISSASDSIYTYLDDYGDYFETSELKKGIRFSDLLTMKSGISWNETLVGPNSPTSDLTLIARAPDRVAYLLSKPIESVAGQRFSQNNAASLLIVKALESAFQMQATEILDEFLFGPLDIDTWKAAKDEAGLVNVSFGMSMRPVDVLKIGYLCLQNGLWEGRQIVSEDWIEESTSTKHRISNFLDTGYLWWRFSEDSSWQTYFPENRTFYAFSEDNQYLFVLPEYDMVYLLTSVGSQASRNVGYYVLSSYLLPYLQPIQGN